MIGIDFDAGYAGTSIRHRPQHVDSAARPDDRELPVRPQNIGQRRWRRHQVFLPLGVVPARHLRVHDVRRGIGVDDNSLRLSLAIDLHPRERVPARELYPCRVAEHSLGVYHVDEAPGIICAGQRQRAPARANRRFGVSPRDSAHIIAAAASAMPATRMAFGPPSQFSSGTTARQASAPPHRSAP